jgi:hypothetical protein
MTKTLVGSFLLILLLAACAGYGGRGLVVGESVSDDALRLMGPPAMEWAEADGSRQFAYPRGPAGVHTYMLRFGSDGKLAAMENVLTPSHFGRIQPGMSSDAVARVLGPPTPAWTVYFERRNELVWEWRYCDDGNQLARFDVLFDATTRVVRSTLSQREDQINNCSLDRGCWCSR